MSWIYFRYEWVYRFCKERGCIGHNTRRCNLSAFDVQCFIQRRVRGLEENGMTVLQTQEGIPRYTNMVRGISDRLIFHNPKINLYHILPNTHAPQHDPYLFPHLYRHENGDSESSSKEFFDAPSEFWFRERMYNTRYYSDVRRNITLIPQLTSQMLPWGIHSFAYKGKAKSFLFAWG